MKFREFMTNVWEWCKSHITIKNLLIVLLLVFIIISIGRCSSYKHKYGDAKNTITIIDDSLYDYKNKLGEMYKEKKGYISDINTLEQYNKELADEVKNLRDNPIIVTKVEYKYLIDSIYMRDSIRFEGDEYVSDWGYRDEYLFVDGKSRFNVDSMVSITTIDTLSIDMSVTLDMIEKDHQLSFIAKSDNPYVHIDDVNGAIISPEKSKVLSNYFSKRNHIGLSVGAGVVGGYGLGSNGTTPFIGVGGFVGITYTYSIFSW